MRATIIDDEKILSSLIRRKLESLEFYTKSFYSYHDFCIGDNGETDIYLLDISLWDGHGFDIVRKIRANPLTKNIPILLMSWHDTVSMKVEWLNLWADDYIVKPFHSQEFIARVKSLIRRKEKDMYIWSLTYKDFTFDMTRRELVQNGEIIKLMKKERQLLELFFRSPGIIISKEEIANTIWKRPLILVLENSINVTICKLRKRLGNNFILNTKVGEWYILE